MFLVYWLIKVGRSVKIDRWVGQDRSVGRSRSIGQKIDQSVKIDLDRSVINRSRVSINKYGYSVGLSIKSDDGYVSRSIDPSQGILKCITVFQVFWDLLFLWLLLHCNSRIACSISIGMDTRTISCVLRYFMSEIHQNVKFWGNVRLYLGIYSEIFCEVLCICVRFVIQSKCREK